jgi:hypothetical protein
MGIQNFHKWLISKYPESQINNDLITNKHEHLYIDMNFLLHYCSYGICLDNENILFHRLTTNITYIINSLMPKISLTLVTDGSPPLAKLITQRKRRILMARNENSNNINHLKLTVGTEFMESLGKKMHDYITETKKKYKIEIKTIFQQSNEAEINILKKINSREKNDKNVIVSNDADTIVMSCASNNQNIYIVNLNSGKKMVTYSIKKLMELFMNEYKVSNYNFVFSMLLMGNDYLPKVHFINFNTIIKSFTKNINLIEYNDNTQICTFNNINMIYYFRNIICNISNKMNNRYKLHNYNYEKIKYYLEGIIWCITNYVTNSCKKYDYMYCFDSIEPLDILYFFEMNNTINIEYPLPLFEPINKEIYPILILPKKAIHLINKKFHDLINSNHELQKLYEEEECLTCIKFHNEISIIHKKIKDIQLYAELDDNNDIETLNDKILPLKKKIGKFGTQFEKHKISHQPLNLNDINTFIHIISSYC